MSRNGNGNGLDLALAAPVVSEEVPAVWLAFIRYCRQMGFGEIEKLRIQDGLPVLAEVTTRKIKFDA